VGPDNAAFEQVVRRIAGEKPPLTDTAYTAAATLVGLLQQMTDEEIEQTRRALSGALREVMASVEPMGSTMVEPGDTPIMGAFLQAASWFLVQEESVRGELLDEATTHLFGGHLLFFDHDDQDAAEPWYWHCKCLGETADGFGFLTREAAEASMTEHRAAHNLPEWAIDYGRAVS